MDYIKVGDDVNSNEVYAIASYGPISVGLHYFTTDWYGAANTDGTTYAQVNFEFPISDTLTVSAHAGSHSVEGSSGSDYEDYSVSLAYDAGDGYSVGLDFIDNSFNKLSSISSVRWAFKSHCNGSLLQ